jgi:hypothetical protein
VSNNATTNLYSLVSIGTIKYIKESNKKLQTPIKSIKRYYPTNIQYTYKINRARPTGLAQNKEEKKKNNKTTTHHTPKPTNNLNNKHNENTKTLNPYNTNKLTKHVKNNKTKENSTWYTPQHICIMPFKTQTNKPTLIQVKHKHQNPHNKEIKNPHLPQDIPTKPSKITPLENTHLPNRTLEAAQLTNIKKTQQTTNLKFAHTRYKPHHPHKNRKTTKNTNLVHNKLTSPYNIAIRGNPHILTPITYTQNQTKTNPQTKGKTKNKTNTHKNLLNKPDLLTSPTKKRRSGKQHKNKKRKKKIISPHLSTTNKHN